MRTGSFPIISFCLFVLVLIMTIPPASAYGVGLGPTELQVNNVLRGTSVERSITLYNLGEDASTINLTADGAAAGWIKFYDPEIKGAPVTVVSMKAKENKPLKMQITVPPDTANGVYNTTIHATIKPPASTSKSELGVTATMEASSTISIRVTGEQSVAGTVEYITIDNTEVNFPLPIRVLFQNTGNVAANPDIRVTIIGRSGNLDSITDSSTPVNAGISTPVVVKWTKTNIEPGDYSADVKVFLAGTQIANKNIPFNIAPTGTLSRQGNLTSLTYMGNPVPDSMLKIIGNFENRGKIETKAKMIGEVYRNGVLVDSFTSEELSVPINDLAELTYYLKVTGHGNYLVKAYVLYEGKKTDIKEMPFNTDGTIPSVTGTAAGKSPLPPGLAIIAIIGAVILIASYKRRVQ